MVTVDDLNVRRLDDNTLMVSSELTRGNCARIHYLSSIENLIVIPCLIPVYMLGITTELILEATRKFLANEK